MLNDSLARSSELFMYIAALIYTVVVFGFTSLVVGNTRGTPRGGGGGAGGGRSPHCLGGGGGSSWPAPPPRFSPHSSTSLTVCSPGRPPRARLLRGPGPMARSHGTAPWCA